MFVVEIEPRPVSPAPASPAKPDGLAAPDPAAATLFGGGKAKAAPKPLKQARNTQRFDLTAQSGKSQRLAALDIAPLAKRENLICMAVEKLPLELFDMTMRHVGDARKSDQTALKHDWQIKRLEANPTTAGLFNVPETFEPKQINALRVRLLAMRVDQLKAVVDDPRFHHLDLKASDNATKYKRVLKAMAHFQLGIPHAMLNQPNPIPRGTLPLNERLQHFEEAGRLHVDPGNATDAMWWGMQETTDPQKVMKTMTQIADRGAYPVRIERAFACAAQKLDTPLREQAERATQLLGDLQRMLPTPDAKKSPEQANIDMQKCRRAYRDIVENDKLTGPMVKSWYEAYQKNNHFPFEATNPANARLD